VIRKKSETGQAIPLVNRTIVLCRQHEVAPLAGFYNRRGQPTSATAYVGNWLPMTMRRSGPVAPIERKIGEFDVGLTPEGRQSRPIFPWTTQVMSQMISPMLQQAKEGNS
jgi:hypothetical protein